MCFQWRRLRCRQAPWVQQVGILDWRRVHDAIAVRQRVLVGDEIGFAKPLSLTADCRTKYRSTKDNRIRGCQRAMHDILLFVSAPRIDDESSNFSHIHGLRDRCALWSQRSLDSTTHQTEPLPGTAVVPLAPNITSLRADPPDDASSRNLKQRPIARAYEVGVCSVVSHRAIVSDPSATVGPESDVERTIESRLAYSGIRYERLVTRLVTGEIHDLEHKRFPRTGKVDELDLVTDFWGRGSGIRRREAEITLQGIERRSALHRTDGKGVRHEVDA